VVVDSKLKLAYVQDLYYYGDCVRTGLVYPGGGSILMKMIISFLKENKKQLDIEKIQLKDNSTLFCESKKIKIDLALLHTFVFGTTWYGKYGFMPYDYENDKIHDANIVLYGRNKKLIETILVKNTKIKEYLKNSVKMEKLENKTKNIDVMLKDYGDKTVSVFIKDFMKNFQKGCALFSHFYRLLAVDIGITNFYGQSFILYI